MDLKLEHIGIVVEDIDKARIHYETVFLARVLTDVVHEPAHNVYVQFLDVGRGGLPSIELIMPAGEGSKISSFLKKTGGGIHHMAYAVRDIDKAIEHFKANRSMVIGGIVPGAGHGDVRTVWLFTSEKQLIELIELTDE